MHSGGRDETAPLMRYVRVCTIEPNGSILKFLIVLFSTDIH